MYNFFVLVDLVYMSLKSCGIYNFFSLYVTDWTVESLYPNKKICSPMISVSCLYCINKRYVHLANRTNAKLFFTVSLQYTYVH